MAGKEREQAKWGAGHAAAMGRMGLNELRNSIYADSNVAQRNTEMGVFGQLTPGEIADDRRQSEMEQDHDDRDI